MSLAKHRTFANDCDYNMETAKILESIQGKIDQAKESLEATQSLIERAQDFAANLDLPNFDDDENVQFAFEVVENNFQIKKQELSNKIAQTNKYLDNINQIKGINSKKVELLNAKGILISIENIFSDFDDNFDIEAIESVILNSLKYQVEGYQEVFQDFIDRAKYQLLNYKINSQKSEKEFREAARYVLKLSRKIKNLDLEKAKGSMKYIRQVLRDDKSQKQSLIEAFNAEINAAKRYINRTLINYHNFNIEYVLKARQEIEDQIEKITNQESLIIDEFNRPLDIDINLIKEIANSEFAEADEIMSGAKIEAEVLHESCDRFLKIVKRHLSIQGPEENLITNYLQAKKFCNYSKEILEEVNNETNLENIELACEAIRYQREDFEKVALAF